MLARIGRWCDEVDLVQRAHLAPRRKIPSRCLHSNQAQVCTAGRVEPLRTTLRDWRDGLTHRASPWSPAPPSYTPSRATTDPPAEDSDHDHGQHLRTVLTNQIRTQLSAPIKIDRDQRVFDDIAQLGQPFAFAPALPISLPALWLAVATVPAAVLPAPAVSGFAVPGWLSHQSRLKLCPWLVPSWLADPPLVPLLLPPNMP